jgi:branched-chain amino acid aminotransferase
MKTPIAYYNGRFLPAAEVSIPLDDAGFVWGATVTDRARTFNGKPFRLQEHLRRFRESCILARVPLLESDESLTDTAEQLVRKNRGKGELSVIWIATPGSPASHPTLIAYAQPIDPSLALQLQETGVSLISLPKIAAFDPRIKHRSRLAWWISKALVQDSDPAAQPLFLDVLSSHALETPTSNVIAVINHELVSPPAGTVLEGVSLGVVEELCKKLRLRFVRRALHREDLDDASEILLTNTTDCIVGVSRLDGQPVPFPGPMLHRLLDAWSDLVGVNLRGDAAIS